MGYQFFLPMVLRWRALRAEAPLLREALPIRDTVFRLQVFIRVGISQVEVYKRVGKSGHLGF